MTRGWRPRTPEPVQADWLVASLATVGVAVTGYLTWTKATGGSALFCTGVAGCEVVQASRYAMFLGMPTAAWGAALYATVGALALTGLTAGRWLIAFLVVVGGMAFSGYLTYLELFVIAAVCWYCVVSAAVTLALFGVLLGRRPRGQRTGPARLIALGAGVAAVTVMIGISVHAVTAPGGPYAYQQALARHLAQSGAVMYGAFW
jgi:uncharacterized membrane protein